MKNIKLTSENWKNHLLPNVLPGADGHRDFSEKKDVQFKKAKGILDSFKYMYDSLFMMRQTRSRCRKYNFGDQLSDLIYDPDGKKTISEREYMKKQGIPPLELNIIRKMTKALVGVYRQERLEPSAISRDREEQKLGEMMTIALQYAYQTCNAREKNARGFEELLMSSVCAFRTGFDVNHERENSDVYMDQCDINRMAWDRNTTGMYFENISTIGYMHDMQLGNVLSHWAHNAAEKEAINNIYKLCKSTYSNASQQFRNNDEQKVNINFYSPTDPNLCRVFEIWTKEAYDALYCHDMLNGNYYFVTLDEEKDIINENEARRQLIRENGGTDEDVAKAPIIQYEYKVTEKWVYRYMTPFGDVLEQGVSPYAHGSHPFAIGAYPLVDGEIHSFVEDTINIQRMVNRLIMRIEFTRMNAAKGFVAFRKKVVDQSNTTAEKLAEAWASPKGFAVLDFESGEEILKQYKDDTVNQGDVQMLQQYFKLLDEVTGVSGSLRGESAPSGTPSSLYMQMSQNSNNNIADLIDWYNGLIRVRDQKLMSVIQQFYQGRRFINIAGKSYSDESRWYDSDKIRNSQFDLSLVQSQSSGIPMAANENMLLELLKNNAIDIITYLESSNTPFAEKLLERIKAHQSEMQSQQEAAAQLNTIADAQGTQTQQ